MAGAPRQSGGFKLTLARWRWGAVAARQGAAMRMRKVLRRIRPRGGGFERFEFAPPDLRTSDPTMASDIYSGLFVFAGRMADTGGYSPFEIEPPSRAWAEVLNGFGWLRHLSAADTVLARDNARSLVTDFIGNQRAKRGVAAEPAVAARRVLSFLGQSTLLLTGADHEFYEALLDAVRADVLSLRDALKSCDDPSLRLALLIALTAAGLCIEGAERYAERHGGMLAQELDVQIGPDGGHVSRNPRILIDLMLDLLPLKAVYAARGAPPPADLLGAMDRITPLLRMLRHPDGSIALFNGMGAAQVDALATIFASHDVAGRTPLEAPFAGYQRLEAEGSVLIADAGPAPPFAASGEAMAGALSFEFSAGRQKLIVNCGLPRRDGAALPVEFRATAAHSVAMLEDISSCSFISREGETRVAAGPRQVEAAREPQPDAIALSMSHDGYAARAGVILSRRLVLSADGASLSGEDGLRPIAGGGLPSAPLTARFHLHPTVKAGQTEAGLVLLAPPQGPAWVFSADGAEVTLEESAYFAGAQGARRTTQIVLRAPAGAASFVWALTRRA